MWGTRPSNRADCAARQIRAVTQAAAAAAAAECKSYKRSWGLQASLCWLHLSGVLRDSMAGLCLETTAALALLRVHCALITYARCQCITMHDVAARLLAYLQGCKLLRWRLVMVCLLPGWGLGLCLPLQGAAESSARYVAREGMPVAAAVWPANDSQDPLYMALQGQASYTIGWRPARRLSCCDRSLRGLDFKCMCGCVWQACVGPSCSSHLRFSDWCVRG